VGNYGSGSFSFRVVAGSHSTTETVLPGERWTFTGNGPEDCACLCFCLCGEVCVIDSTSMRGELFNATGDTWHWGGDFSVSAL